MRPYTARGATRSQIDRAGRLLRRYLSDPYPWESPRSIDQINAAFDTVWLFRGEFQTPLTKVVMGLRSFLNTEGADPVVVGQRLKRMPTILDKLERHPTMALSNMQDIGGCRAILPAGDFDLMRRVRARILRRGWDVVEEYDYVAAPKRSGYRGLHLVVRRDQRLIEIQLRTVGQHDWAETVERLGSMTRFNLKDGQGPEDLLHYLERAAYGTDLQERGLELPTEFRKDFIELTERVRPYFVRG